MKIFEEYRIKDISLRNRIVMPPMCLFIAGDDGMSDHRHFTHYTTSAVGGIGLIIVEATSVSRAGRISVNDLGMWDDAHIMSFKEMVSACQAHGAKVALQIAHAGRKGCEKGKNVAPSAIAFNEKYGEPIELTEQGIQDVINEFKNAAARAVQAGFDMIELHAAHGYLLHQFLSPLTNKRTDAFGGSTENRARFVKLVLEAMRSVMPKEMPMIIRVSATDYDADGIDIHEMVNIVNEIKALVDMVHVSTGGILPAGVRSYPGYQVEFSRIIKEECNIPTIAVGLITDDGMVEEILESGRADLVALGRELLRNPYWVLQAARKHQIENIIPVQYKGGFM